MSPLYPLCPRNSFRAMNKLDLAVRLARQLHRSQAKAADDVDKLVYEIMEKAKRSREKGAAKKDSRMPRTAPSKAKR